MKNIPSIFAREIKAYFVSPIAYVVLIGFVLMSGLFFAPYFNWASRNGGEASMYSLFYNMSITILFVAPLITMRLFAEEKRSGTIEILMTSPVTEAEVVVGKFAASVALFAMMLALTFTAPLFLKLYGNPDLVPMAVGYLGTFLLGVAFLSLGVVTSAITKNQIVAALVSFIMLLGLWIIGWMSGFVGSHLGKVLSFMSLMGHSEDFRKGILDTKHIIYYVSFASFCLFLATRLILMKEFTVSEKRTTIIGGVGLALIILTVGIYATTSVFSWYAKVLLVIGIVGVLASWILSIMTSRAARYGSNVVAMILLGFCILVLVNFVSARRFGRVDTTAGKRFSLSEQTKKILNGLDQDVKVSAFYTERHFRWKAVQDLLNEYAQESSKFRLSFIDPVVKPGLADAYQIRQNGTVVFELEAGAEGLKGKREMVENSQNEEQDFTSAILKLLSTEQKKVYFLGGHGEADIDGYDENSLSNLKRLIEFDNYLVEKLMLAQQTSVPSDCSILVIAGPKNPLLPQEEDAVARYLSTGGKAIIMVDPRPSPSLSNLLKRWGVETHDDIVMAGYGRHLFTDPSVPFIDMYGDHAITTPLGRRMTFFPMTRSLAIATGLREGIEVLKLLETASDIWGEMDLETFSVKYDEGTDIKGPVTIAVTVALKQKGQTLEEKTKEKRVLVVIGDSDFVMDKHLRQSNPDFFMNSMNWLVEDEELISIRPRDQEQAIIQPLSSRQLRFVMYSSILAIPLILLVIGGIVWWKRR